ncbi:hypothetical protein Daus18300_007746 [Diaporthe australafricana]|uniref:Uncharacterized protein n=1 Tax=Diaporthe australafricana TaxID=127596 RepID=A0ABR3WLF4_9PEZI
MAAPALQPLDDALVGRLRNGVDNEAHLMSDAASNHWRNLLQHFQGRTDYEIRGYIAENFRRNRWAGNEPWFTDVYVQALFNGYDRTAFDASNRPALDAGARDSYHPSNASVFGRGNLFPSVPTTGTGQAELDNQQFAALTPAQRQLYQLASVFGGNRFHRVPDDADPPSTPGPSGAPKTTTNPTQAAQPTATAPTVPVFDNTIGDGDQGAPGGPSSGAAPGDPSQGAAQPGSNTGPRPNQGDGTALSTPRGAATPVAQNTPAGAPTPPNTNTPAGGQQAITPAGGQQAITTAGGQQALTPAGGQQAITPALPITNTAAGGPQVPTGPTGTATGDQPGSNGGPGPASGPAWTPEDAATNNHDFRGQRQPPVSVRLRQMINYIDESDIDRDQHWEMRIHEVEEYLNQRLNDPATSDASRAVARDGLGKIQAHRIFNQNKYGPHMPNRSITADMIPAPRPRLKYDGRLPLILGRDRNDKNNLLPHEYPTHPRTETAVNDMWLTDFEAAAGLDDAKRADRQAALAQDEDAWWQLGPNQVPAADNASYLQSQTFEACIAVDGVGFNGWVDTRLADDGVSLVRTIWNGDVLGDCKGSYARERAVRRAGLQAALRQFSNAENRAAITSWRRVRLPLSADEVDTMHRNAGAGPSRKFDLPKVRDNQVQRMDGKDDPQGFTANMAQFWSDQNRDMERARNTVLGRMNFGVAAQLVPGRGIPTVMPPMSLWGAYVDCGLSADDQYHREMLSQMTTTKKLFDRELNIAPRELLRHMKMLYDRGFSDLDADFDDPVTGNRVTLQSLAQRDADDNGGPRDLDKMEIYWIRFLLTQSITPQMTQQLQPRATLFILFADKLASIFSDVSDPLFPSNETRVSVEDLLDYIHKKTDGGPVKRVRFYAHDVQMWLERLQSQGRCRYQEDWRCYGWVMRPEPTCYPEQLIRWTVPVQPANLRPDQIDEDLSIAPRFRHLRNWHSLIERGLQNSPLDQNVANYFRCLAFRWGHYMLKLTGGADGGADGGLQQQWRARLARPTADMVQVMTDLKTEYDTISQWNNALNNPLVQLVKRTLPARANDATLTADQSLQIVRDHIIDEAVKKHSTLWPARNANDYRNALDEKVRPPVWGWARTEVRGQVKRFFSVNRWPLQLQTQARQRMMTDDADINVDFIWKVELEDPTPAKYYRPMARPYVDEKVRFRPGHRNFAIGDTPHQKHVVIDRMFAQMSRAMGAAPELGLLERWSAWTTYLRSRLDGSLDDGDDHAFQVPGSRLRRFNAEAIPRSYDPRKRQADQDAAAEAEAARRAQQPRVGNAADVAEARQADGGPG